MDKNLNYYEILEFPLDPLVTDPKKALELIDIKKKEWDKKITSSGSKGVVFKCYKDQIPDMKEKLGNPDTLKEQGRNALDKAKKSVQNAIQIMAKGGKSITESSVGIICETYPTLSKELILRWISEKGLKVCKDTADSNAVTPTKPAVPTNLKLPEERQLNDLYINLSSVNKNSVYEVIKCTPTSSAASLKKSIGEFKDRTRKMPKGTGKSDAYNRLSTLIPAFFADEPSRKGFDYAWANYKVVRDTDIEKEIKFAVTGKPPRISRENYLLLIKKLREAGMGPAEAEWFVYDQCCNKWKAPFPAPPSDEKPAPPQIQCPNCYALNDANAERCNRCKNWLVIKCPKCGKKSKISNLACSCGFALGDIPLATQAVDDARKAFASKNWTEAEVRLRLALTYWPGNEEATILMDSIGKIKKQAEEELLKGILKDLSSPNSGMVSSAAQISIDISWNKALLNGKEISGSSIALPSGGSVSIKYRLVRKKNGTPSSLSDGDTLTTTSATRYEDTTAEPGVIYGYTVFVIANETPVGNGCPCGKGQIIPHPDHIQVSSGDRSLTIAWKRIPSAKGIVLVRKKGGIPSGINDGERLTVPASSDKYTDTGLTNDSTYGYLFAYRFANANGQDVVSDTVTASGIPINPPPALLPKDWTFQVQKKEIYIKWQMSGHCQIKWYISDKMFASAGDIVLTNDAYFSAAQAITQVDQAKCSAQFAGQFAGQKHITPVVIQGTHALICQSKPVVLLPGVSNLQLQRSQGRIVLTWQWPDHCEEVVAAYGNKAFPNSPDDPSQSGKIVCKKGQYDLEKGLVINNAGDSVYYFAVFASLKTGEGNVYSSAQNVLSAGAASKQKISYKLKSKKNMIFFGKKTWHLEIESSGSSIPCLEIRKKRDVPPLNRNDGIRVMVTEAVQGNSLSIELPEDQVENGSCYKIFTAESSEAQLFAIDHGPVDQLTID